MQIFTVIFLLLFPVSAVWLAGKIRFLNAIIICYAVGLLGGNFLPDLLDDATTKTVAEGVVILALPMLLFSADFKSWLRNPGKMLKAYFLLVVSVVIAAFVVFYFFKDTEDAALITAMYSGVISGGTPNLNAIGVALEAGEKKFVLLNSYDVVLSGSYFFLLITMARSFLTGFLNKRTGVVEKVTEPAAKAVIKGLTGARKQMALGVASALGLGIIVLGIVAGLSFLFFGGIEQLFVIITSSTAGIALSFVKKIRAMPLTFETGDFLLLAFALGMGYLARFDSFSGTDFTGFYLCAAMFGLMLLLHLLLCKLFSIDADHFIISSTAGVFGPPFIGPVANATGNRSLIASGVAVAVIGHAFATYLGVLIYGILS